MVFPSAPFSICHQDRHSQFSVYLSLLTPSHPFSLIAIFVKSLSTARKRLRIFRKLSRGFIVTRPWQECKLWEREDDCQKGERGETGGLPEGAGGRGVREIAWQRTSLRRSGGYMRAVRSVSQSVKGTSRKLTNSICPNCYHFLFISCVMGDDFKKKWPLISGW